MQGMRRSLVLCMRSRPSSTSVVAGVSNPALTWSRSRNKDRRHRNYSSATTEEVHHQNNEAVIMGLRNGQHTNGGNSKRTNPVAATETPRKVDAHAERAFQNNSRSGAGRSVHNRSTNLSAARNQHGSQVQRGVKRKANDDLSHGLSTQRSRTSEPSTLMDLGYIKTNFNLPSSQQYPDVPRGIFDTNSIVQAFNSLRGNPLNPRHEVATMPGDGRNPTFRCTLKSQLPDKRGWSSVGEGRNKPDAIKAAYTRLLADLYAENLLERIFPPAPAVLTEESKRNERDAKTDIYNYAARFLCIPGFSSRVIGGPGKRARSVVEVTITLKEQGLKSVALGRTVEDAEIAAAIKFKEDAEKYHAKHGDASIVIKDATALNTSNVKSFFDFYKMRNRGTTVTIESQEVKGKSDANWETTIAIRGEVVAKAYGRNKTKSEEWAQVEAAVSLINERPGLFEAFQEALMAGNGTIVRPAAPVDLILRGETIDGIQKTLNDLTRLGLTRLRDASETQEEVNENRSSVRERQRLDDNARTLKSRSLKEKLSAMQANPAMKTLLDIRESLPMTQYRDQVRNLVKDNTYCIIMGATGSGKTTQVPQILLEDAIEQGRGGHCDIICTQPRRIAATSVAERVAKERGESLRDSVGYHVRFDAKAAPPGGSINYCTTGILLQQLQHMPDEMLDTVSHIVIDEVHERDILIDFLMILLKKTMRARRLAGKSTPKVILMSATINEELFATYFQDELPNGTLIPCPSISVPGRTFPVKERYFENIIQELEHNYNFGSAAQLRNDQDTLDYIQNEKQLRSMSANNSQIDDENAATIDWKREKSINSNGELGNDKEDALVPSTLVGTTIAHIAKTTSDGAILVFLPGYEEIKAVGNFLRTSNPLALDFNDEARFKLYTLHSSVPANEQLQAFDAVPEGCRKIILSTNIAETSVTIPDVQYVVDTGKIREKRYNQLSRITKLQCTWVSKSNAKQRAGRAGRVQNGNYYALYSRARYESMRNIGLPEMLRSDLQEICLDIKAQAFKTPIRDFLAESIEPPAPAAVDQSVRDLIMLQALTEEERLTPLGRLLAALPVHPSLGKMILLGVIFRCLDPMIILGAAMNERSPLARPPERRNEAQEKQKHFLEGAQSDHLATINAIRHTRMIGHTQGQFAARRFAEEYFVHMGAYKTITSTAEQIEEILVDSGIIPYTAARDKFEGELGHPTLNKNANNVNLLRALIISGVHPNIAICKGITFRTTTEQNAMIPPASLNYIRKSRDGKSGHEKDSLWAFTTMQKSNDGQSMFMRDSTVITPLMSILFGGRLHCPDRNNIVTMDKWLPFFVGSDSIRNTSSVVRTVLEFRKAFDKILSVAYSAIKPNCRARSNQDVATTSHAYLADDKIREAFATGLVDVLDKDASKVSSALGSSQRSFNSGKR